MQKAWQTLVKISFFTASLGRMNDSARGETDLRSPPTLPARIKASLLGAVVATLAAPAFWFMAELVAPSGFWIKPVDVLFASPAIWLFAGLIAVPTSLCLGPVLFAFTWRLPRPQQSASVLGALVGAAIMYILPVVVGSADRPFSPELSVFGAATGALGAGVAAHFLRRREAKERNEAAGGPLSSNV
ncbi:hypothetical protein SAMN05216303_1011042 [Rhodoferax sp. OV413]|uniref:hypothetical protein n=1 Tax=Rhodoferax sp. OV413 TaxID=1855285 RepID=UPI00089191AF|nr:hypothetical protein [Rhodoferax sp. OV413]SDO29047.1 hypothetical protein SAMN05216303_1011042 [Rhodoferax sp. OV413]